MKWIHKVLRGYLLQWLICLKAVAKLAVDKFAVIKFAVDKLAVEKFAVGQKSCWKISCMIKKAVEKGLTQKNCYLGIKPLVVNFMEEHSYQLSMQKYIS